MAYYDAPYQLLPEHELKQKRNCCLQIKVTDIWICFNQLPYFKTKYDIRYEYKYYVWYIWQKPEESIKKCKINNKLCATGAGVVHRLPDAEVCVGELSDG